jgi:hypothetical protein
MGMQTFGGGAKRLAAMDFSVPSNPDFKNYAAFDFGVLEMDALHQSHGRRRGTDSQRSAY